MPDSSNSASSPAVSVTKPYPREWSRGHLVRLQLLNELPPDDDQAIQLRRKLSAPRGTRLSTLVAEVAAHSPEAYIQEHSLIPFLRAFASTHVDLNHGADGTKGALNFAFRTLREDVYCCLKCIETEAVPILHRDQQMPGVDWCTDHKCALHRAPLSATGSRPPTFWFRAASQVSLSTELSNPVVCNYVKGCLRLVRNRKPASAASISRVLARKMKGAGFRVSPDGKAPTLSNHLRSVVPQGWLFRLFPKLRIENSVYVTAIDCVGLSAYTCSTAAYVLAIAVLYDDPEEAFEEIAREAAQSLKSPRIPRQLRQWPNEDEFNSYVRNRGRMLRIASERNEQRRHTARRFAELGLPSLHHVAGPEWRALREFLVGTPLTAACERNGAEATVLEQILRRSVTRLARALKAISAPPISKRGQLRRRRRKLSDTA